jgi:hypothetical protein
MVQTLLSGVAISLVLSLFVVSWIMWRLEVFAKQTDE